MGSCNMSAEASKTQSQERIQVPVMDERASSAARFDELAHMGYPMDYHAHAMHPGHPVDVGYDYGFMPASASSHFPAGYGSDGYVSRYNREGVGKGAAISIARRDYHFMADMDPNARHSHTHQGTWNPFYSKHGQGWPAIFESKERYSYGRN